MWHTSGSTTLQHQIVKSNEYYFHWHDDPVPLSQVLYCKHQQDAVIVNWKGLVVGLRTDASVDEFSECMGAGYAMVISLFLI